MSPALLDMIRIKYKCRECGREDNLIKDRRTFDCVCIECKEVQASISKNWSRVDSGSYRIWR